MQRFLATLTPTDPNPNPTAATLASMVGMAASRKTDRETPRMQAPAASSTADGFVFQACTRAGQNAAAAVRAAGAAAAAAAATFCCWQRRRPACCWTCWCLSDRQAGCHCRAGASARQLAKHAVGGGAAALGRAASAAGGWIAHCAPLHSSMAACELARRAGWRVGKAPMGVLGS